MTPPDSGEHRAWCSGGRIDRHGTRLGCDCKPDSGEREVCPVCLREKIVRGDGLQEDRCWRGFLGEDDRKCYRLGYERLAAGVVLPLSLAQRILAALEECGEVVGPGIIFPRHTDLADELRKAVGK